MKKLVLLAVAILVLCAGSPAAENLSYEDLVNRLMDLEQLATLPEKGSKCAQWSSYDRRSKYDAENDKYVAWDANGDNDGCIRKENGKFVMAEMDGPGVIWRIWSALPEDGHVRIYIDGKKKPAVDMPFKGYFNRENKPFVYPSLVHTKARGKNCYVPIPYQKSCKIVADEGWGAYYHFTYQKLPAGTKVPSFSLPLSKSATQALQKADDFLSNRLGNDPAGTREGQRTLWKRFTVQSGETATVADVDGPRALTALKVNMDFEDEEDAVKALRQLTLKITWDGQDEAAVWTPLGDFFGTAHGVNHYKSLPLGMTQDEFYSFWYMPFAKNAKVEIANDGDTDRQMRMSLTFAPLERDIDEYGRFHCKWHRDAYLPEDPDRQIDWTLLTTEGRGRYCGVMQHVCNPRGSWWGEGDEKFFVDGENFPSTFGTGSEDYYGYAWCNPTLFENAFHNQTISMGNRGHISVNRWHIADNLPFHESFEGYIEKYFPNDRPTLYAATAYWYLAPGGDDPYDPRPVDERIGYCPEVKIHKEKGAIEGEKMDILKKTGGTAARQGLTSFGTGWSHEAHLWWRDAKPEDELVLALPVEESGTYKLQMQLTKAKDYGIVQLALDGKPLGDPIDLYNANVVPTGKMDFGTHTLDKGTHKLKVEITGANEKAIKSYMFGLDWVKLIEQDK